MLVKKACEYFKGKDIDFNLNLTLEDIKDQYTMDFIVNAMEKTNTAKQITFEIVESEGIESFTEVSNFIKKAKKLGCKIAIDDFGTGYSNFEYIIKLDVDYIKIDGSLITDLNSYLTHAPSIKGKEVVGAINTSLFGKREYPDKGPLWNKTFDIDIIFGEKTGINDPVHIIIEGVAIQSCHNVLSGYCAGTPPIIQEQYSFIARDITTIG